MISPFSKFQKVDDIQPCLESEDRVVYPICDNIIFTAKKCLDPLEDGYIAFDKNQATIVGLFHKQVLLFSELYAHYKEGKMHFR